jgi:hypothetical protein
MMIKNNRARTRRALVNSEDKFLHMEANKVRPNSPPAQP